MKKTLKLSSEFAPSYLTRFLAGERVAQANLPYLIHDQLIAMSKALARDLPADLHGEVVSQTWCQILERRKPLDTETGTVRSYFRLEMQNAIKVVRASYAPSGAPKRDRDHHDHATECTALPQVLAVPDVDETASESMTSAETKVLAAQLLVRAPTKVSRGLLLVHVEGRTVTEAAELVGTTRFTLDRAINRFAAQCQEELQVSAVA